MYFFRTHYSHYNNINNTNYRVSVQVRRCQMYSNTNNNYYNSNNNYCRLLLFVINSNPLSTL